MKMINLIMLFILKYYLKMQVFPLKAINKFILNGDNSPVNEEISPK